MQFFLGGGGRTTMYPKQRWSQLATQSSVTLQRSFIPRKTDHIQQQGQFTHLLPSHRALPLLCWVDPGRASTRRWSHDFPSRELIFREKTDQVLTVTQKCCLGGRGTSSCNQGSFPLGFPAHLGLGLFQNAALPRGV